MLTRLWQEQEQLPDLCSLFEFLLEFLHVSLFVFLSKLLSEFLFGFHSEFLYEFPLRSLFGALKVCFVIVQTL